MGSVATSVPSCSSTETVTLPSLAGASAPFTMVLLTQLGGLAAVKPSVEAQNFSVPDPSCGMYRSIRVVFAGCVPGWNGQNVMPPSVTVVQFLYRFVRSARVKVLTAAGSWVATVVVAIVSPAASPVGALNATPPVAGPMAPVTASRANGTNWIALLPV